MGGKSDYYYPGQDPLPSVPLSGVIPGKPPVVGVAPAVIGCIQAAEVIKYLLGMGDLLAGRLLMYDGLAMTFNEMKVKKDPDCPECGTRGNRDLRLSQSPE